MRAARERRRFFDEAGLRPGPPKHALGDPLQHAKGRTASVTSRIASRAVRRSVAGIADVSTRQPSGEHEARCPIFVVQIVSTNPPVPFACVDHDPRALVDADMRDQRPPGIRREEHQITALQALPDWIADFGLADRATRELDAELLVDVLGEARTVEGVRTFSAPYVRAPDQAGGEVDGI